MNPAKTAPAVTESTLLDELLTSILNDPRPIADGIKVRLAASHQGDDVVMMGGWTN
ncbi:hypothetical protein [Streptomyces lydicus]|uniref:hypothetical protein n=1 Tax=Streptomyces lydicus TaxID=47763 RepID=UPI0037998DE9